MKSFVALLLLTTSANAADLTLTKAPIQSAASYSWSGIYLSGFAGYGADLTAPNIAGLTLGAIPNGPMLGGGLKVLYQLSNSWVIGVGADLAWANMRGTSALGQAASLSNATNYLGCACAQLGYLLDPKLLVSLTGGLGYGGVHSNLTVDNVSSVVSDTSVGYAIGGRLDYALTSNLGVFTETRYYHLGGKSVTLFGNMTATTPFDDLTQTAGLSVKF